MAQVTQTELQNISVNNMQVSDSQHETSTGTVQLNVSGYFKFTAFAVNQFLKAYAYNVANYTSDLVAASLDGDCAKVLALLGIQGTEGEQSAGIQLTRANVLWLKKILEMRMKHCEEQRDQRCPGFNPDTYIGQKHLLLDLREWLIGEVVEDEQPVKMLPIGEALGSSYTGLMQQIRVRQDLRSQMVGSLYTSIIDDEIDQLRQKL